MSKLKEKSKTSSEKNKKDHGTRNMIIFLVIFSIVCIGVTSFLILKNNNSKISNVMENIKENVSKNKNEQSQNDVQGVSSLNDTYAENPIKISKEKISINGKSDVDGECIQIDGMKDEKLQQKINDNIKEKMTDWCNSNNGKVLNNIDVKCTANFGNAISIKAVKDFDSYNQYDFFVMNIDLSTGNEIKFNEMFTSNAGIKSIISESAYDTYTENASGGDMTDLNDEPVFSDGKENEDFYYETEEEKEERKDEYAKTEDKVFKLLNSYNNDNNLKFYFTPRCINIYDNDNKTITIKMKKYYSQIAIYNRFKTNDTIYDGKYENQDIIENKNIPVFVSTNTTNVGVDVALSDPVDIVYLNQQKKSDNIFYNVVIDKSYEGEKDKNYNTILENVKKIALEKIKQKEEENKKNDRTSFYQISVSIGNYIGYDISVSISEYSVSASNRENFYNGTLSYLQSGNYIIYWENDEYDDDYNPWKKYINNSKEIMVEKGYIDYNYDSKSKELVVKKIGETTVKNQATIENNTNENKTTQNNKTIVIDAGHQAKANNEKEPIGPGASETKAKVTDGATGVSTGQKESELNLKVSQMLEQELTKKGYNVIMTRTEENVNMSNSERAQIANNANATAFIRIHANSADSSSAKGVLTMCQTSQNKYNGNLADKSYSLSKSIVNNVAKATGTQNRGVTRTDDMSGINWCKVPATIVEMGFLSNSDEDKLLADENYQKKIVNGIINGLEEYLNS